MPIVISPPISQQIYSTILERISNGSYAPGSRIPSESDIASELNVSRASVRTALVKLETSGQIFRRHGEGTFVSKRPPTGNVSIGIVWEFSNLIKETNRDPRIEIFSIDTRDAYLSESEALEIEEHEQVLEVVRLFYADNDPVIYTKNVIPEKLLKVDPRTIDGKLKIADILKLYFDLDIAYIDTHISSDVGDSTVDQFLKLSECTPLLRLEEVFFSSPNERPILLSDSYLNTMKIKLHRIRPWGWLS